MGYDFLKGENHFRFGSIWFYREAMDFIKEKLVKWDLAKERALLIESDEELCKKFFSLSLVDKKKNKVDFISLSLGINISLNLDDEKLLNRNIEKIGEETWFLFNDPWLLLLQHTSNNQGYISYKNCLRIAEAIEQKGFDFLASELKKYTDRNSLKNLKDWWKEFYDFLKIKGHLEWC